jgi:uncharacterized caspase-like protein
VLAAALVVAAPAAAQPAGDTRVAVVIGNGAYASAPLANTGNDAKAVAAALRDAGFQVIELRDGTQAQMQDALDRAAAALRGRNGVGLFYFAGHGVQLDWHNYLLPVDARQSTAAELRASALGMQSVVDAFRIAGNRVSVLIVDACRDNPFVDGAGSRGLAQMDAPPGTLLAFATAPGRVAEDGNPIDGNGLYTHHLVRELRQPGVKVEDVFKRVRVQVRRHSEGRQVPWESTSLEDDFYFDPAVRVTTLADAERARAASAELARERAEWARIRRSTDPDDFVHFLLQQKSGEFAEAAELKLHDLRQMMSRAKPGQAIVLPDAGNRYATGDAFDYVHVDGYTRLETRITWRVNFADDEVAEFNNGEVLTQQGAMIRDSRGYRYEPPRQDLAPQLQPGKTWRSEFRTWRGRSEAGSGHADYTVSALETLSVPAGSFEAFRVEIRGEASQAGLSVRRGTAWFDRNTLVLLQLDMLVRTAGRIDQYYSLRLAGMKRAPRWNDP